MQHCDTLIVPRWIVPVDPADMVLDGHAVAVSDGRIVALLPVADSSRTPQPFGLRVASVDYSLVGRISESVPNPVTIRGRVGKPVLQHSARWG